MRCIALLPCCHTHDALYWRIDGMRVIADRLRGARTEDEATVALVTLASAPSTQRREVRATGINQ